MGGVVKKISQLLLVTFATLAFVGCDFRVKRDADVLVRHLDAEPSILNPITYSDAYASTVMGFVFDSLLERNNVTLKFEARLAKSWEVSADQLTYTFYLRDDVYWHDGERFTADDVIYSFEQIMNPKVDAARLRNYYRDVSKAEKIDDFTVRFTYAYPYYRALVMLAGMSIVPKHIYDDGSDFNSHAANRAPIGNGPYKFAEWKTSRRLVLVRNENYWGDRPDIAGIVFKIVTDSTVALQVLKKGEIDMAGIRAIAWVKQTDTKNFKKRFNKHRYYLPGYSFISWNMEKPYFKDKRVRRAMTMMINRKKIVERLLFGQGEIVTGGAYPFGPDYDKEIKPYRYDPQRAVELLEEAGWRDHDGDGVRDKDGVPFKFLFMFPAGSSLGGKLGNMLREDLAKAGIEMEITRFEWTIFLKNLNERNFDATTLGWTGQVDYDPYQVWHSSQMEKGSNFMGFKNTEADRLIEEARREFDPEKRHEMYKAFHKILHEEQPYTFLFINPSLVVVQKRFENVVVYRLGVDSREWRVTEPTMELYQ